MKPLIGVTMGDAAGIGPEVVIRACADERVREWCRPVVFGHPQIMQRAVDLLGADVALVSHLQAARCAGNGDQTHTGPPEGGTPAGGELPCVPCRPDAVLEVRPGTVDPRAGRAAHDALIAAGRAALRGEIDAVVTAPLNKLALNQAGFNVPGHTEVLAKLCDVDRFAMMLYLPAGDPIRSPHGLCVAHVTLHTSIASVPRLLTTEGVAEKIELVDGFLRRIGCDLPRIAVCALNPHAGEDGLFGDEERRIIAPAVKAAQDAGRNAAGPFPADTLIRRAVRGEFDGLVAMYHDQGHIPFKLIGCDRAVNITLGLPIVRTSPSHGTAFDLAWTGQASAEGLIEAIRLASVLANRRHAAE
jgi:4-hydroxythreonine-4-phosphate dehydrogenase